MSKHWFNLISHSLIATPIAILASLTSGSVAFAQHASHHHLMIGRDNLETLTSGDYAGQPNPNYNHLTLLFPHQHQPVETSGFHRIGAYSYTGDPNNPTITSTNNQIPETSSNLPPLPLFPGTGIFANQMVSQQTNEHMYSDLKTKPVAHLVDDLSDPYVYAIYNSGNGRWNDLLGEEATIGLELLSITPGLGIANNQGQDLFNGVGDIYIMGQGDYFTFTPIFYASESNVEQNYSATFRLLDVNDNNRIPWLPSGSFTINVQAAANLEPAAVPESSNLLALGIFTTIALISYKR